MFKDIDYPEIIHKDKITLFKKAYLFSCKKDVTILKPGNVHSSSPHTDTNAEDYIKSSIYSSEMLFNENLELGQRVLESVSLTSKFIKKNTNLGIILTCAPLIHSLIKYHNFPLKEALSLVLKNATTSDTIAICKAINIANPGGLGKSKKYDTHLLPNVGLIEIMEYSSKYDRISYQYTNLFRDILDFVVLCLNNYQKRYESLDLSISLTFLEILSEIPDSHIQRKFGHKIAKKTSNQANDLLKMLVTERINRDSFDKRMNNLDYEYKKQGINPGTTADLLVAGLMIKKIFENS